LTVNWKLSGRSPLFRVITHEWVVRQTVQEGSLSDDLMDRVLDGRSAGVGYWVEIER
jgi:hypothetical protein